MLEFISISDNESQSNILGRIVMVENIHNVIYVHSSRWFMIVSSSSASSSSYCVLLLADQFKICLHYNSVLQYINIIIFVGDSITCKYSTTILMYCIWIYSYLNNFTNSQHFSVEKFKSPQIIEVFLDDDNS